MNRRNFLLGVGTAATLSGAASVTGGALSNTVATAFGGSSNTGFNIINTTELIVRRNGTLTDQNVLSENENFSDTSLNFSKVGQDSPVDYSDFPELYVDNRTDGDLTVELATGDDPSTSYNNNLSNGGTEPYNGTESYGYAPLVIENTGDVGKDIAMQYTYANDVTNSNELSKGQVAELYRFDIDGTQISPQKSTPDQEGNSVTIPAATTKRVDLQIQLTEATADDISSVSPLGDPYAFDESARSRTSLLDAAVFGVADS
jgi:hypothetical protein